MECLTDGEAEVLEAILERLIPADANGPGAREAQVLRYIDRALAGELRELRAVYAENLPAVDAYAAARHGDRFAALDDERRDAVLAALEAGVATGFTPSASDFFELVRLHAIEGMFGDPSHGGNDGGVGWDLIGFPGIKVTFTAADQQLDTNVDPVGRDGR